MNNWYSEAQPLREAINTVDLEFLEKISALAEQALDIPSPATILKALDKTVSPSWSQLYPQSLQIIAETLQRMAGSGQTASTESATVKKLAPLLQLLDRRVGLAQQIGILKSGYSQPIFHPQREQQVLSRLKAHNCKLSLPLDEHQLCLLYREIISICRAVQIQKSPLKVACLGPSGTFAHIATEKLLGHALKLSLPGSLHEVFLAVENRSADLGIVPVENSTVGIVPYTLNYLFHSNLGIIAQLQLPINLQLAACPGTAAEEIQCICAHQQALTQCLKYLRQYYCNTPQQAVESNGAAARLAAENPGWAALVSSEAAASCELDIIDSQVNDNADNATSFLVFAHCDHDGTEADTSDEHSRMAVIVTANDHVGALCEILDIMRLNSINLSRLYSWPSNRRQQQFSSYLEFQSGPQESENNIAPALNQLNKNALQVKQLGHFPYIDIC